MKNLFITAFLYLMPLSSFAQDGNLLRLDLEARVDYVQEYQEESRINNASGFKGRYLNIRMDGNITDNFSFSYRQRLNKPNKDASLFDATDWITASYTTKNWTVSGGKQVVGIGGYEYDGAPIDLYFCSEFWNNIACYQFGVSGSWISDSKKDNIMLQFCESPFRRNALNIGNKEMFAYNLMWMGSHGMFSSLYSVNLIEYLPGKYINYIALGNRFTLGNFRLDLDLMNRAINIKDFFGKDFSIMCEFRWFPSSRLELFAKLTQDSNFTDEAGDWCVAPGTSLTRIGGGLEFYPLKDSKSLRLHINCCHTAGKETLTSILRNRQTIIDGGITWKMNMLNMKRRK